MLSWPMIAFGWVTNMLQRGMASWKRMLQILDTEPAIRDQAGPQPNLPAIRGEIEFRNLSFSFGETPILRDVSVRIPAGQTTAIVGVTGSGSRRSSGSSPACTNRPQARCSWTGVTCASGRWQRFGARLDSCPRSRSSFPTQSVTTWRSGSTPGASLATARTRTVGARDPAQSRERRTRCGPGSAES